MSLASSYRIDFRKAEDQPGYGLEAVAIAGWGAETMQKCESAVGAQHKDRAVIGRSAAEPGCTVEIPCRVCEKTCHGCRAIRWLSFELVEDLKRRGLRETRRKDE